MPPPRIAQRLALIENSGNTQSPDLATGHTGGSPTIEYHGTLDMALESLTGSNLSWFVETHNIDEKGAETVSTLGGDQKLLIKTLIGIDGGPLEDYIGVKALKPFINNALTMEEIVDFAIPNAPNGRGVTAEQFMDICRAYVAALQAGQLRTKRQREIALKCALILANCGKIGLIALIDEATGYQKVRASNALQVKLQAWLA